MAEMTACGGAVKAYAAEVLVHYGRNLPKTDLVGTSDPYVVVRFGKNVGTPEMTTVMKNTLNPDWGSERVNGDMEPGDDIRIELWDQDAGKKDDMVATVTVKFSDLPIVRREFALEGVSKPGALMCISALAFPCLDHCAAVAHARPNTIETQPRTGVTEWYAEVPGANGVYAGLRFDNGRVSVLALQSEAADLAAGVRATVSVVRGSAAATVRHETQYVVGTTSGTPPLRRVGGLKGLRVYAEAELIDAGLYPLRDICIRVVRRRVPISTVKLSDVAKRHGWLGLATTFAEAKSALSDAFFDDKSEVVYLDEGNAVASLTCGLGVQHIGWWLTARGKAEGVACDMVHSTINDCLYETFGDTPREIVPGDATHTAVGKWTLAKQPNIMRLEQVNLSLFKEEDTVEVPFTTIFPLV